MILITIHLMENNFIFLEGNFNTMKNTDKVTLTIGQLKRLIKESNSETILDIIHSLKRYKCPRENMPAFEVEMTIDNIGDRLKDAYNREFGPNSYEKERTKYLAQFWKEPNLKTEAKDDEKKEPDLQDILDKIVDYSKLADAYIDLSIEDKSAPPSSKNLVKDAIQSVLYWSNKLDELYHKKFGDSESL